MTALDHDISYQNDFKGGYMIQYVEEDKYLQR